MKDCLPVSDIFEVVNEVVRGKRLSLSEYEECSEGSTQGAREAALILAMEHSAMSVSRR